MVLHSMEKDVHISTTKVNINTHIFLLLLLIDFPQHFRTF
jgi:hypothetical protein